MSQNLDSSSMEFHCARLNADGVAANFSGSWQSWGKIDLESIRQANPETVYSLMEKVKLTFNPLTTPVMGMNPVTGVIEELPDLKNVWNGEGRYIATVGANFNALSHWQTIEGVLPEILETSLPSRIISFESGARMMAQFYVKSIETAERSHNAFLTIYNGLDGRTPLRIGWTLWSPVCSNTFASAKRDLGVSKRHSKSFSTSLHSVRQKIGLNLKEIDETASFLDKASKVSVNSEILNEFLSYMIPVKENGNRATQNRRESLADAVLATSAEVGGATRVTAYDLFAGTTRYTSERQQNRGAEEQLDYVMDGPGAEFNTRALQWVMGYVNSQ